MSEQAPMMEVAQAVTETVANPGPESVLADIELAISLVKQLLPLVRNNPSIMQIVKWLV